ncbi:hypothetical protein E1218_05110 [Kribbella turkmenica]|uniref:DUF485 domain-containing protein n=1 Tax=Kribbella turkmenica TaxID=2530375 RepID=A0A4R4XEE5_9ACTN|nr:hypothetical protein [Kribbella turkmenica]TDD29113.1 hypothetical protein E1218_05110 [Kribbella turkmenica]
MSTPEGPRRVRVTSPRTSAARRPITPTGTREIDEQTRLGEVYMHSLIQSQLRLALAVIGGATVLLGGIPLLFALVPATRTLDVLGVPLPWVILGVAVYPVVYVAARVYVRNAERIEAEFTEFVGRQ